MYSVSAFFGGLAVFEHTNRDPVHQRCIGSNELAPGSRVILPATPGYVSIHHFVFSHCRILACHLLYPLQTETVSFFFKWQALLAGPLFMPLAGNDEFLSLHAHVVFPPVFPPFHRIRLRVRDSLFGDILGLDPGLLSHVLTVLA